MYLIEAFENSFTTDVLNTNEYERKLHEEWSTCIHEPIQCTRLYKSFFCISYFNWALLGSYNVALIVFDKPKLGTVCTFAVCNNSCEETGHGLYTRKKTIFHEWSLVHMNTLPSVVICQSKGRHQSKLCDHFCGSVKLTETCSNWHRKRYDCRLLSFARTTHQFNCLRLNSNCAKKLLDKSLPLRRL